MQEYQITQLLKTVLFCINTIEEQHATITRTHPVRTSDLGEHAIFACIGNDLGSRCAMCDDYEPTPQKPPRAERPHGLLAMRYRGHAQQSVARSTKTLLERIDWGHFGPKPSARVFWTKMKGRTCYKSVIEQSASLAGLPTRAKCAGSHAET